MSDMAYPVNQVVLKWARERVGLTIPALAVLLKIKADTIDAWESGHARPSYSVLERLAYRFFKIPVAVFYFPEPPDIPDPVKQFRRLPELRA